MVYVNYYRIIRAYIYEYDGSTMTQEDLALQNGESECVYHRLGRNDFTGGWHGDELLTSVDFYIDGSKITPSAGFDLRPCSEFKYIEHSTTHETSIDGINPIPGHPVEAIHRKETVIKSGGYTTSNSLTWQQIETLDIYYSGISTISIPVSNWAENQNLAPVQLISDDSRKLEEIGNYIHYWQSDDGYDVKINSQCSVNDSTAEQFIWDRSTYHKFYRNSRVGTDLTTSVNEIYTSVMSVVFDKLF